MCACLKEHMTVHCVFCALCMVYLAALLAGIVKTATDKARSECKCSDTKVVFQRAIFLILVVRNDTRSSGIDGKTSDCPSRNCLYSGAQPRGGGICPPKFSKHCIAILTFAETFKEQKMKFYILIIVKKSYLNFLCLAC